MQTNELWLIKKCYQQRIFIQIIFIYYTENVTLNNLQRLICDKTQLNNLNFSKVLFSDGPFFVSVVCRKLKTFFSLLLRYLSIFMVFSSHNISYFIILRPPSLSQYIHSPSSLLLYSCPPLTSCFIFQFFSSSSRTVFTVYFLSCVTHLLSLSLFLFISLQCIYNY